MQVEGEGIKQLAIKEFENNNMTKESFENLLDAMFRYGHYVGHCQGEYHVKQTYGLLDS